MKQTYAGIVSDRSERLREYQNAAYAGEFETTLHGLEHPNFESVRNIAAKNLHKLMSYKDEYEVARMYSSQSFKKNLKLTFSDSYKISIHLAPPLISRFSRNQKIEFGAWIFPVLKFIQKGKILRGSAFDLFGYSKERKFERLLIEQYKSDIKMIMNKSKRLTKNEMIKLLSIPEQIRGFGHIKLANIEKAQLERTKLLKEYTQK